MKIQEFEDQRIPLVELFQSISGEGISAGNVVTFIRVAGCDLRCSWCDTKYAFSEEESDVQMLTPDEIMDRIEELGSTELICTGGEPLEAGKVKRYLPAYLAGKGYTVHIETSGACPLYTPQELKDFRVDRDDLSYCMDVKCPGSGMQDRNRLDSILELCADDELKFVVRDRHDMEYALQVIHRYRDHLSEEDLALNFSPVFESLKPVEIAEFLKEHAAYFEENDLWPRLSLQLHKYIWPPHMRGV